MRHVRHRRRRPLAGAGRRCRASRCAPRRDRRGALLAGAAVIALAWANSPWSQSYYDLIELHVGPSALHLDLTLGQWAADGLLAVFFLVAGLELEREFVAGDLRDPGAATSATASPGWRSPTSSWVVVAAIALGVTAGRAVQARGTTSS